MLIDKRNNETRNKYNSCFECFFREILNELVTDLNSVLKLTIKTFFFSTDFNEAMLHSKYVSLNGKLPR